MNKLLLKAALVSAVAFAGHAAAQSPAPVPSIRVSYSDLDLTTSAGREALSDRLRSAVNKVCSVPAGGIDETLERQSCIRDTSAEVRRKADIAIARAKQKQLGDAAFAGR